MKLKKKIEIRFGKLLVNSGPNTQDTRRDEVKRPFYPTNEGHTQRKNETRGMMEVPGTSFCVKILLFCVKMKGLLNNPNWFG